MAKKSKKQVFEDFSEAMLRFILANKPEGFKDVYFIMLVMCGRLEEAAEYLTTFNKEPENAP